MKALPYIIAAIVVLGAGLTLRNQILPGDETEYQERERLRIEADADFRTALTNDIVGLSRVISIRGDYYEKDIAQWRAEASVEYINKVGGIERTNVIYAFKRNTGSDGRANCYCFQTDR
jgi:hypothetical protein